MKLFLIFTLYFSCIVYASEEMDSDEGSSSSSNSSPSETSPLESSPLISPSLTSTGRKRMFNTMMEDTIDLVSPPSSSNSSAIEIEQPSSNFDFSIFDNQATAVIDSFATAEPNTPAELDTPTDTLASASSLTLRSNLRGTRALSPEITGIRFSPDLGDYERVDPATHDKSNGQLESLFWRAVYPQNFDEAARIIRSGFGVPNSEYSFHKFAQIVRHERLSEQVLRFLATRTPNLFNNHYQPNGRNIFMVATQQTINFVTRNFSYDRKMMRMVFLAVVHRPEISLDDALFQKKPEDPRIIEWRIRKALELNARSEILRQVYLLPRGLSFFMRESGETPLTQVIKSKNIAAIEFILQRKDACQNIFFKNYSGDLAILLASKMERTESSSEADALVLLQADPQSFPITRMLVGVINRFYTMLVSVNLEASSLAFLQFLTAFRENFNSDRVVITLALHELSQIIENLNSLPQNQFLSDFIPRINAEISALILI